MNSLSGRSDKDEPKAKNEDGIVGVMLDIEPKRSWLVRTQPGALRRIIMNLLGNALKYTTSGFVAVSLRAAPSEGRAAGKIDTLIRVVDSGKGMSDDFMRDRLFVPFSQEDTFQPGTGLGLSIVKQIVDSLGGTVDVQSQQNVGTEIEVRMHLNSANEHAIGLPEPNDVTRVITPSVKGKHMVLLDPWPERPVNERTARLQGTLRELCENWYEMRVSKSVSMDVEDADFYLYAEPPAVDHVLREVRRGGLKQGNRLIPLILVCLNAEEAITVGRNQVQRLAEFDSIVEVIPQPAGPRKLAKVLQMCMRTVHEKSAESGGEQEKVAVVAASPTASPQLKRKATSDNPPISSSLSFPSPPPLDPATPALEGMLQLPPNVTGATAAPDAHTNGVRDSERNGGTDQALHILLVDDNRINLQLLMAFMKKNGYSYAEAENGLEALQKYQASCGLPEGASESQPLSNDRQRRFDYVLMDISMPIMNGLESTRRIRAFEREHRLSSAGVIALTGLASKEAHKEAETAGVDVFLPKPVRFAALKRLLVPREDS